MVCMTPIVLIGKLRFYHCIILKSPNQRQWSLVHVKTKAWGFYIYFFYISLSFTCSSQQIKKEISILTSKAIYTYKWRNVANKIRKVCTRGTAYTFGILTVWDDIRKLKFNFTGQVIIVKLINNLLSFSINLPDIAKLKLTVRCRTRFGGLKSVRVCIK